MNVLIRKNFKEPPFCEKEILRYAGCKSADMALLPHLQSETDLQMWSLMQECIDEIRGKLCYKVCYRELSRCDFESFTRNSKDLTKNLQGCHKAILFAATVGVEMDRLIGKYSRVSPSKALMMQAIGAERIEALCDMFCEDMKNSYMECATISQKCTLEQTRNSDYLRPRFSPGYGDLSLEVQREIFKLLDCPKQIGLSLNDSLLMSPSKSVTAFVGLSADENGIQSQEKKNCTTCHKTDCAFREV